jgi:hypothetical protein
LEGLESARHWASDKFYGNDDETIRAEFRGKNRYLVEDRDLNNDGDPEVVIRRNHDKSIYAINGYRVVPSKHHQRRAYFDLFPNPVARQQPRDDRITPKNYIKRIPKYIMRKHCDEPLTLTTNQQEDELAKSKVNQFWRNSQNRKSASPKPSITFSLI